jgi:nucleotide-binding universal stress UspA family protein
VIDKNKNISKILVPIDGSHPSMDALEYAIEIAKKNKSQVIILTVIDFYKYPYSFSSTVLAPTFGMEKYMEEKKEVEKRMDELKEKYNQNIDSKDIGNIKSEIIEGTKSVAATIVEYSESEQVDLIIIGSRGKTGFKKMLIGSVSFDVVKYAHCSVLVKR